MHSLWKRKSKVKATFQFYKCKCIFKGLMIMKTVMRMVIISWEWWWEWETWWWWWWKWETWYRIAMRRGLSGSESVMPSGFALKVTITLHWRNICFWKDCDDSFFWVMLVSNHRRATVAAFEGQILVGLSCDRVMLMQFGESPWCLSSKDFHIWTSKLGRWWLRLGGMDTDLV